MIIKCSDKSKSLVAMSDTVYRGKAENILANTEDYELADMTPEGLEQVLTNVLKRTRNLKNLPPDVYNGLFPRKTSLPQFYGLPKIHKADAPLRPVVAAFDGPLTAISILLERILHLLLTFVPAHIPNTVAATKSLETTFPSLRTPSNAIVVTMDVVALYPSIPIEDGIAAAIEKLKQHENEIDTLGIPLSDIETLLRFVLTNNYFQFGEKGY